MSFGGASMLALSAQTWDFGDGKDANGYTKFKPSVDSQVIYVSTQGGASCTAIPASQAGADIFRPTNAVPTCNDISEAKRLLRAGYPDFLLFRRGETWNRFPGYFEFNMRGRSKSELMVVGSYAPASDTSAASRQRPRFVNVPTASGDGGEGGVFLLSHTGHPVRNVAITDLDIFLNTEDGNIPEERFGLRVNSYGSGEISNVLIENMKFSRFNILTMTNQTGGPRLNTIAFRKNLVLDGLIYGPSNRGGGLLGDGDFTLIEENIFDRNGWRTASGPIGTGAHPSSGHAVYCEYTPGDVYNSRLLKNVFMRNTSVKFGSLGEGPVKDNTWIQNAIALIECCRENQVVENNVITETLDYDSSHPRGMGMYVSSDGPLLVKRNLLVHGAGGRDPKAMTFNPGIDLLTIEDNTVSNWCSTSTQYPGLAFELTRGPNDPENRNLTMRNNTFDQTCQAGTRGIAMQAGGEIGVLNHPTFSYSNNRYYTADQTRVHWDMNGWYSFQEWLAVEPTASFGQANFPSRFTDTATFVTLLRSLGVIQAPRDYPYRDLAAIPVLANAMREQSKWNYKPELTADFFNNYMRNAFGMNGPQLPVVSVSVTDVRAAESNSNDRALVKLARTGATTSALTIRLSVSGVNVTADDYRLRDGTTVLSGSSVSVVIPAGATEKTLSVEALADSRFENAEHLKINIQNDSAYSVNNSARQTVTVLADNGIQHCLANVDGGGLFGPSALTANDYQQFVSLYAISSSRADFDESGDLTANDFNAYSNLFSAGCPGGLSSPPSPSHKTANNKRQ